MPNVFGLLIVFGLFGIPFAASFFGDAPPRKTVVESELESDAEPSEAPGAQPDTLSFDDFSTWRPGTVLVY